jgi:hypothetical protein
MPMTHVSICCMCKTPLAPDARQYRCSVSSCNSGKFKLRFCGVACWQAHLPTARHRNADCVEVEATAAAG